MAKKVVNRNAKVVNCKAVYLRKAPEKTTKNVLKILPVGTKVIVTQDIYDTPVSNLSLVIAGELAGTSDWFKVNYNGTIGYVMKDYIEIEATN